MDKALLELIKISNRVGKDSTLVQGGGGNTSVKTADGKYMYIKTSGTALRDMNEKQGWRRLQLELADKFYFPSGNSVTFMTPAGI
jgi:rhamnose utilization protein RhaD (predicted bifunctional aldolase and dehydrogenase)